MPLKIAVQMDHVSTVRSPATRRLRCRWRRSGAATSCSTTRPTGCRCCGGKVFARIEEMKVRDEKGNHFSLGEQGAHRPVGDGRDPAAPGSALRHELHHHHAYPRAHPPEDAGRQRPGLGAQQPGKDLRHRISRPDAGNADHQGSARRSPPSARSSATSSSSRSTAMAAPASSICTRPTATSPRCSKCSARCSASPISCSAI